MNELNIFFQLAFNFGGRTWPINPVDFALATSSASYCVGALFEVQLGNSAYSPQWIVGDSFLVRNVSHNELVHNILNIVTRKTSIRYTDTSPSA